MALATPNSWATVWLAGLPGPPRRDQSSPGRPLRRRNGVRRLREEELPGGAGALPEGARARRRRPGSSAARVLTWRSSPPTRRSAPPWRNRESPPAGRRIARESNSAPAHYYLGMNLGQLARTKGLAALRLVSQMEHEFTRARELDEQLDWAGPDRNLGLLYRDAPAIGSVGSRAERASI